MTSIREDFLLPSEPAIKLVPADAFDKMMARENFLDFTSSQNSEVETVDWNNPPYEGEGDEDLDSLNTPFNHWKPSVKGAIINDDFFAVAGRGKLCKGAGLTGAEKRACKKIIKSKCKGKPLFGRAKKEAWAKCAEEAVVTPEESAQEAAERLVPDIEDTGMSMGAKIMIVVAGIGTIALIGFSIARSRRIAVQPSVA